MEGYNSISLGNMILRTETAAVVGGFLMNITGEKKWLAWGSNPGPSP